MTNNNENGQLTYDSLKNRLGPEATASLLAFLSHTLSTSPSTANGGTAHLTPEDKEELTNLFRKLQDNVVYSNNTLQTEVGTKLTGHFQESQKAFKDINQGLSDMYQRLNNMETNIYHLQEEVLNVRRKQSGVFFWLVIFCLLTIAGTYAAVKYLKL
jgi:hypothetical protein